MYTARRSLRAADDISDVTKDKPPRQGRDRHARSPAVCIATAGIRLAAQAAPRHAEEAGGPHGGAQGCAGGAQGSLAARLGFGERVCPKQNSS